MTDKKILDAEKIADEILIDNELEKVAGGDSTGKGHACAADNVPVMFDPINSNNGASMYFTTTGH